LIIPPQVFNASPRLMDSSKKSLAGLGEASRSLRFGQASGQHFDDHDEFGGFDVF
jgi:hypothetical protein